MELRRIIFWGHLISGIAVGLVVFVMAVTGALMAFQPQLVKAAEKAAQKVTVPAGAAKLDLETLLKTVSQKNPRPPVRAVTLSSDPSAAAVINFGKEKTVFVDPYTGEVTGEGSALRKTLAQVENIHRRLALGDAGMTVTEFCNAMLFLMILSGLYLWWPNQWTPPVLKSIMFFKSGVRGKVRDWNWHNVTGFWCAPLLLMTTLTGLIMSYTWASNLLYRATGSEPPPAMQRGAGMGQGRGAGMPEISFEGLNNLWAKAQQQAPEWKSMTLRFNPAPGAPAVFSIQQYEGINAYKRSQLTLNAATGETVKWEPYEKQIAGKKLRILARYLHTGEAGGIIGQALVFTGALGASLLVWTGLSLSWRRFFPKKS